MKYGRYFRSVSFQETTLLERLKALLPAHEEWLMARILSYARRQNYTKYTSTLLEAWRLSISGLSSAIIQAVDTHGDRVAEFTPDADYAENPIAEFGITEARLHRKRGVSLVMFLGLLKYYRQTYQDLIREKIEDPGEGARFGLFIIRCFDLLELAVSVEWNSLPADTVIEELQRSNRQLTNEKNRYLTLFESISDPVFLINEEFQIENYNVAASRLLAIADSPGGRYYKRSNVLRGETEDNRRKEDTKTVIGKNLGEVLHWMAEILMSVAVEGEDRFRREIKAETSNGNQHFMVTLSAMLDVTGRYEGAVVVVTDITGRKRLEEEILKLASTDELTGICNRRSFIEHLKAEIVRSRRYHHPLSVLMMDLDFFKEINDSYGHHMGDLTLKRFAETCLASLRENDLFARIGGEEFATMLTETGPQKAFQVAERVREKVSETPVSENGISFNFQVSIGVATLRDEDSDVEEILQNADQALYRAKRSGRNRVVSALEAEASEKVL